MIRARRAFPLFLTASLGCGVVLGATDQIGFGPKADADTGPAPDVAVIGDAGIDAALAYRDLILANHPVAYWRMGAIANQVVRDETTNHNDLEIHGLPITVQGGIAGDPDTAIRFEANSSWGTATNARALDFTVDAGGGVRPFTLEAWVKHSPTACAGNVCNFPTIFRNADDNPPSDGYLLYGVKQAAGPAIDRFQAEVHGQDASIAPQLDSVAEPSWMHVVLVRSPRSVTLWVDNQRNELSFAVGDVATHTTDFYVAYSPGGAGGFTGALDELVVYDYDLKDSDVAAHFKAATGN